MQKILTLFACMFLFLAGCTSPAPGKDWVETPHQAVNDFDGVTLAVMAETITAGGLTVEIENRSSSQVILGAAFWLEQKIEGAWYQVPLVIEGEYGFPDIGYELAPGSSGEWAAGWEWLYGSLDAGEYRILKEVLDFRSSGNFDTYVLAGEFSIE